MIRLLIYFKELWMLFNKIILLTWKEFVKIGLSLLCNKLINENNFYILILLVINNIKMFILFKI